MATSDVLSPAELQTPDDALALLERLGASARLLRHLELVGEAADQLLAGYARLGISCDARLVRLGVAVHDAGKVLFPGELDGPGAQHEPAGEKLLLSNGVPAAVARCCRTHAAWRGPDVTFDERSVALADKLWEGARVGELELLVIDAAAERLRQPRWTLFVDLDSLFEQIAAGGHDRLTRSQE